MTETRFRQAFLLLRLALVIAPLLVVLGTGANEALRVSETTGRASSGQPGQSSASLAPDSLRRAGAG